MSCTKEPLTFDEIKDYIELRLTGIFQGSEPNQYCTKPVILTANGTPEEIKEKVAFYNELRGILKASELNKLERTKSGAIRKGPRYFTNLYAWDERRSSVGCCITVCLCGFTYVLKFGNFKGKAKPELYPNIAFNIFKSTCEKHGVDLDKYIITNGNEVKKEIPAPMIEMYQLHTEKSKGIKNVHHIDFHNSFPAGLANTHPEFRPAIDELYQGRKEHKEYKFVLNDAIGWMQSWCPEKGRFAAWAHLSRDAIKDNNDRIHELTERLMRAGRIIIGHNTDGIWYQGDIYHGDGEGPGLGEWENDYTNCLFRAKSRGAYEFICDGELHVKMRGLAGKDAIEPDRSKWSWGDIYKEKINYFTFTEKDGIQYVETHDEIL